MAVEANSSLKHQKDVIAFTLDLANYCSNRLCLREGLVDRLAKFFHQLFQPLVHDLHSPLGCNLPTNSSFHLKDIRLLYLDAGDNSHVSSIAEKNGSASFSATNLFD